MSESKIPSELRLSQHWDIAVERLVINATIGLVVGGLASIVVFSTLCLLSLRGILYAVI